LLIHVDSLHLDCSWWWLLGFCFYVLGHAEGYGTTANYAYSHAEGLGTVTGMENQLAVGIYNKVTITSSFVVGNGYDFMGVTLSNAFRVDMDGDCFAGGTFTGGGADYAEYFESVDGTTIPYGTVVELENGKIKVCTTASNAIGVISAKPSVLGNSDEGTGDDWVNKYQKDIWGNYLTQEIEQLIHNGFEQILNPDYVEGSNPLQPQYINGAEQFITKTRTVRILNPDFDPEATYIPRSQRPEWNVVGLLGQIKVLKNQQIPSTWIKLKDISSEVATYLVK